MSELTADTVRSDYFRIMDGLNKAAALELFAQGAVVVDDGQTYVGREEILAWLVGPASEFATTSSQLSVEQTGEATVVTVLIAGDFPGGRVELRHRFVQNLEGVIRELTISV
jgi:hypothetical protein